MYTGFKCRTYAISFYIPGFPAFQQVKRIAKAFETTNLIQRSIFPGQYNFISHVLIDFTAICQDGNGNICKKITQQLKISFMTQFLCNGCGIINIKENKNSVFNFWLIIFSPDNAPKATRSVFISYLKNK